MAGPCDGNEPSDPIKYDEFLDQRRRWYLLRKKSAARGKLKIQDL